MATGLTRTPLIDFAEENEIVDALRSYGLNEVAARLVLLREMLDEDPDEPDLAIESLRLFAEFFIQEARLLVPEVGAGPEGFVEAEWRISSNGGEYGCYRRALLGPRRRHSRHEVSAYRAYPVRRNLRAGRTR